jgi:hypothetical protein
MREGMAHPGQWLLTVTEKVRMKDWIFCSSYNAPSVSKSTNEVFGVQEAWHSSNTYPTVANGQAFRIITRHPYIHTHHREGSYLGNDHLTWRGGGRGYGFFSKKNILIPNVAEKIFWFWWRKKKIIWFRVFVI